MKKTLLALALVSVSASFSASAAYVCTEDPNLYPESCVDVKSNAEAQNGDVMTMQNGVQVPVTPKTEVVAMFELASPNNCDVAGDICQIKGFGVEPLHYEGNGNYTVNLSDPIQGAKYFVQAPSCSSTSIVGFASISEYNDDHFKMLWRYGHFKISRELKASNIWNCGQPFVIIKYN